MVHMSNSLSKRVVRAILRGSETDSIITILIQICSQLSIITATTMQHWQPPMVHRVVLVRAVQLATEGLSTTQQIYVAVHDACVVVR